MLVPIYLGSCGPGLLDDGHQAAGTLINDNLAMAVNVAIAHTMAMLAAGGLLAWLTYRYLGAQFVSRSWFNLDLVWAASLVFVGAMSLAVNLSPLL
jgi:small basic protein